MWASTILGMATRGLPGGSVGALGGAVAGWMGGALETRIESGMSTSQLIGAVAGLGASALIGAAAGVAGAPVAVAIGVGILGSMAASQIAEAAAEALLPPNGDAGGAGECSGDLPPDGGFPMPPISPLVIDLAQVRATATMDQKEMASALGIELKPYRRIERGLAKLPVEVLREIVIRFGVSADWILFGENREKRSVPDPQSKR